MIYFYFLFYFILFYFSYFYFYFYFILLYFVVFYFIFFPFFLFYFTSHLLSSPFYSLALLAVTQTQGHMTASSPPSPFTVRASHLYREREDFTSPLSSLVDSHRITPTHARRSQRLGLSRPQITTAPP